MLTQTICIDTLKKNAAANRNSPHAERQKENRIPPASRVVMTIPGINHLKTDLKALIDLASEAEQRQWVNIEAYLDTLSGGIEESRPIEIQHVSSTGDGATLVWVPLPEGNGSFNVFKANLESLGYPLKKQTYDAERCELYRVASHHGGDEYGWVAFNLQNKFACIALTDRIEKMDTLRDQVLASKPPETLIDCSLSIAVINADHSAEAQEYRRRAVQNYRDQTIRNLGTGGSRRLILQLNEWLTSTWLDEYKLLSAEGSIMSARIVLDQSALPSPTAEMKFTASAIPNTALAASLSQLASSKDAYATSQIPESVLFSMCVNAPISELRREKLLSLSDLFTTELRNYLLSLNEENGTGRESAEQLAIGCRQILSDMIESGRCNAIINGSLVDGQSQWIGSLVVPNPRVLAELLPMLHQLQAENDVELSVRKVGNVDIHRIKIGGKLLSILNSIFKTDGECYVGSDADKIWFACGHNALESLATQIETLGPPKSRADIFHLNARVGTLANPLLKMFEKEVQESRPVDSNDARSQRRMARLLSDMKDSVADEHDQLSIDVRSSSDSVNATIKCDTGILRFFGKQIAGFSSENLE